MLIALIEAGLDAESPTIKEAIQCVTRDKEESSAYSLAVRAYALALAKDPNAPLLIDQLVSKANATAGSMYWAYPKGTTY